jgi:CheY-like chemotaxis protein
MAVHLALVLHELATNARKHGALSVPAGRLSINWKLQTNAERELFLEWKETGVPGVTAPTSRGFGTTLIERTLEANDGEASIHYEVDGVTCEVRLPLPEECQQDAPGIAASMQDSHGIAVVREKVRSNLHGKRILLIEDEPLVAMEMEAGLTAAGCQVIGPAGSLKSAKRLIAEAVFDAALVDANLSGHPVDELAAALTKKAVPFAFATGYGRRALPAGFQQTAVLVKPFGREQLFSVLEEVLSGARSQPSDVVPLRRGET